MRIGRSDRRITIERATASLNAYGEEALSWATLITVWAELQKTSGLNESISDRQDTATQTLNFKIRSSTDSRAVTTKDRVLYDSKYYDIQGIEEIGRLDQLVLNCKLNDTTYGS